VESFTDDGILLKADEKLTLQSTDLKSSVRCIAEGVNILEQGEAVIPAAVFGGVLRKAATDELVLEVNSSKGVLKAGRNKTRFAVSSPDIFPQIPVIENAEEICEISGTVLSKSIVEGSSAASQPSDFPKYMGSCDLKVEDNSLTITSTDGKRLALSKTPCSMKKEDDILILASSLSKIGKHLTDNPVKIFADSSVVWFSFESMEFSVRRIDANFPKIEKILNSEKQVTLQIPCKDLLDVIERIDIISKTSPAHIFCMNLYPNENELRISTRAPEIGTAFEILQANVEGEYLEIGFNTKFFIDGLKALGDCDAIVEFSDSFGQIRMKRSNDDSFLYMLMPIRLTDQDKIIDED
ncbi:MAG: DNA polymerase III subunit beta, partial [Synergistaceae bacterium]|nr:DNA polymerase III subunit beta [Synergistaceae bacterium]